MNNKTLKICASLGLCFCLVIAALFANQRVAVATSNSVLPTIENESRIETRCGWFSNPTPANAWLNDKDGEWTIGVQGGYQAEGDYPSFTDSQWVKTNGNYGYGCACMSVTTNRSEMKILEIKSSRARPLSACRKDKKLKRP